jgi:predicted alpha/beta-fold hydrolase
MVDVVNRVFPTPVGWRHGHLQSVRSRVLPRKWDLADVSGAHLQQIVMHDGSGDRLAAARHEPAQPVAGLPLVVLVHGLGGSMESDYIRASARGLLRTGFRVVRVDLRGAGRSGDHSTGLYHAGRTADLRDLLRQVRDGAPDGIAVMGFSLGGNATLKLVGESLEDLPVVAAVAVSAPLDLGAGVEHLHHMLFGWYERFVMSGLREDADRPGPASGFTAAEAAAVRTARTVVEFDDAITAPRNGWRDAAEYYAVNSSGQYLPRISVPTLVIHAIDDPMIPAGPYRAIDWPAIEARGSVRRAITPHGGHVGFHQRGKVYPWYVPQAIGFLRSLADSATAGHHS